MNWILLSFEADVNAAYKQLQVDMHWVNYLGIFFGPFVDSTVFVPPTVNFFAL